MQVENILRKAEERSRAKDYPGALALLKQALDLDSWCGAALLGMAEAYRGLLDDDNCLKAWERYLNDHPADARVLTRVGDLHRRRGMPGMALEYYLDALRVEPGNRHAMHALGDLHFKEQRFREALAFYLPLLENESGRVEVWIQAGNCHRRLNAYADAETCFRNAVALAPLNPFALFGLADALRGQGQAEAAAPCWLRLLEVTPNNQAALSRAGDCFLHLGRLPEAEAMYRRALAQGEDRAAKEGLGKIQRRKDRR